MPSSSAAFDRLPSELGQHPGDEPPLELAASPRESGPRADHFFNEAIELFVHVVAAPRLLQLEAAQQPERLDVFLARFLE